MIRWMRRFTHHGWLVPAIGAVLTTFLVALVLVLSGARSDAQRDARQRAVERVQIAAALMDSILKGTTNDSVAEELTGDLTPAKLKAAASEAFSGQVTVVERHGRVIGTYPPGTEPLGTDRGDESHVRLALNGEPSVSRVFRDAGGVPQVELAVGARAPEGMRVMIMRFPVSLIGGFTAGQLDRVASVPGSAAFLVDDRDVIVAAQAGRGRPGERLPGAALAGALRRHSSGSYDPGDGSEAFFAAETVPFGPWKVVLTAPASSLLSATDPTPGWVLWVMFIGLTFSAFATLILLSRLTSRSRALARANEELARSNREIVLATEAKTRFLASMSHELRTPLNGVIGFAELMYDGRVGEMDKQHREYMGDILTSSRHLLSLINEVLDIAKVESGQIPSNPQPVDLDQLVVATLDGQRSVAESAGLKLTSEVDPSVREAFLDPARFTQVLLNYLSNALKFTPSGGSVHVRLVREDADHVRLEVVDTGPGIAPEDHDQLFMEFRQLHSVPGHGGTGLGLALSKRIVEAQGGRVGVDSAPGKGSRFFAILPTDQRPADRPVPPGQILEPVMT